MSLQLSRGFALLFGILPLSLLANCGSGKEVTPQRAAYDATLNPGGSAGVIRTGIADPGPTKDNCGMRDAFDVAVQHDFERSIPMDGCPTSPTFGQTLYAAPSFFIFSDGTTPFLMPGALESRTPESVLPGAEPTWGLDAYPAVNLPGGAACATDADGSPNNGILRLWGGPFEQWGGGVGSGYFNFQGIAGQGPFPNEMDPSVPPFEGIAFWARRGPEGQSALRVNVIDEQISETYARTFYNKPPPEGPQQPPYCQIAMRCDCLNGKPCSLYDPPAHGRTGTPRYFCWDPAVDPLPEPDVAWPDVKGCYVPEDPADPTSKLVPQERALPRAQPLTCGNTFCESPRPDTQGANVGAACTERKFENNLTGFFCGNRDQEVPEPTERCGNAYSAIVQVDMEWKLYTVPFEEMVQADYAYKGKALDPNKIYSIGFGWVGGWVDFYIDDVGFYKRK